MAGTQLAPEKITSPIQLLAAWFAMLVLLESVLLTAAANLAHPEWAAGYLVIFSSFVVVLVIACVTLMLTKFRPHLQEGKLYAEWLKDKNSYSYGIGLVQSPKATAGSTISVAETVSNAVFKGVIGSQFLITVISTRGTKALVDLLETHGFNVEIYDDPAGGRNPTRTLASENEAVWIGSRIAPRGAIEVLKLAVTVWPHLKYLHLSTDGGGAPDETHEELFLGGATSAAQRYRLKAWSKTELLALEDAMTMEQFHTAIRSKYS